MNAMTNGLLSELERVRGLFLTANGPASGDTAYLLADALFRHPDFLALIEALREPVGSRFRVRVLRDDGSYGYGPWVFDRDVVRSSASIEAEPLYALPTKERDDG